MSTIYRAVAIRHYGGKCSVCGGTKRLSLHHKNGDRQNNKFSNLILFCASCHQRLHHGTAGPTREGHLILYGDFEPEMVKRFLAVKETLGVKSNISVMRVLVTKAYRQLH